MKRREFITLLGGAAAAWPLTAGAQQSGTAGGSAFLNAGVAGGFLRELALGVPPGFERVWLSRRSKREQIEYRWAEGRYDRLPALAADLVARTSGRASSPAQRTRGRCLAASVRRIVPIVFAIGSDPVGDRPRRKLQSRRAAISPALTVITNTLWAETA